MLNRTFKIRNCLTQDIYGLNFLIFISRKLQLSSIEYYSNDQSQISSNRAESRRVSWHTYGPYCKMWSPFCLRRPRHDAHNWKIYYVAVCWRHNENITRYIGHGLSTLLAADAVVTYTQSWREYRAFTQVFMVCYLRLLVCNVADYQLFPVISLYVPWNNSQMLLQNMYPQLLSQSHRLSLRDDSVLFGLYRVQPAESVTDWWTRYDVRMDRRIGGVCCI